MATAFVLLNVDLGKDDEVLTKLRELDGVKQAYQVYGVYDIIAKLEGEDIEGLKSTLQEKVRRLDYVRSTLTLIGV